MLATKVWRYLEMSLVNVGTFEINAPYFNSRGCLVVCLCLGWSPPTACVTGSEVDMYNNFLSSPHFIIFLT